MAKEIPTIDYYSIVSLPLRLFGRTMFSEATGFFYERGGVTYLVSNWHVMSGRNPYTGQPRNKMGEVPDRITLDLHQKGEPGRFAKWVTIELGNDETSYGETTWKQHPDGQEIDLAVVPMSSEPPAECVFHYAVAQDDETDMSVNVGMDVFIVGFPLGLKKQGNFPVWKRGSIASEPNLDADGLPIFLVDSATREGMSGSPVYARTHGGYLSKKYNIFQLDGRSTRFLGVYSGRYGASEAREGSGEKESREQQLLRLEMNAQLGRVWRREVLDELIDNAVPGTYEIRR